MKASRKIIWILTIVVPLLTSGQEKCGNPGSKLEWLRKIAVNKNSYYLQIKDDFEFINPLAGDVIADVGNADGYYPLLFSVFSDSVTFYLNDIANDRFIYFDSVKTLCERVKGRQLSNSFTIVMGNDSSTNLAAHFFDKVIIQDALHHFSKPDKMLADVKRIMKPQAQLFLYEPLRDKIEDEKKVCKGAMTKAQLLALLKNYGFEMVKEMDRPIGFSWFEFRISANTKRHH
jgi:2-polyprenyl-3-methyl-5-hydroxy-6-metoxy-1,4-benzoquinol methylase